MEDPRGIDAAVHGESIPRSQDIDKVGLMSWRWLLFPPHLHDDGMDVHTLRADLLAAPAR
jgi:hypothetical protein